MYNPLNEDLMFQQMEDRVASMQGLRKNGPATRRWWRREARLAG